MINAQQLQQLGISAVWVDPLNETFQRFGIDTAEEQACFIGQFSYESNHFKDLAENLNYRAETLVKLWPKRFTPELAAQYAHQPEKIANFIYANRMGNRDEKSGDGWRFRGSGICQLTGHDNFYHAGKALGVDLIANPVRAVAVPPFIVGVVNVLAVNVWVAPNVTNVSLTSGTVNVLVVAVVILANENLNCLVVSVLS